MQRGLPVLPLEVSAPCAHEGEAAAAAAAAAALLRGLRGLLAGRGGLLLGLLRRGLRGVLLGRRHGPGRGLPGRGRAGRALGHAAGVLGGARRRRPGGAQRLTEASRIIGEAGTTCTAGDGTAARG